MVRRTMPSRREIVITRAYRALGRSTAISGLALRTRNISTALLGHRLTPTDFFIDSNGERWLIEQLAATTTAFADVGANVGDWSAAMLAAAPGARGVLFEPSSQAAPRLRQRFAGYPHVHVVEAAVSDRAGRAGFHEEPDAGETSSLLSSNSLATATLREVAVVTVDGELERLGVERVDVLKIDAEGFDLHVMRGAERLLAKQQIGVVQFEYNVPWAAAGSTLGRALQLLSEHGYRTYLLRADGLWTYDYERLGELFVYANFVALDAATAAGLQDAVRGPVL